MLATSVLALVLAAPPVAQADEGATVTTRELDIEECRDAVIGVPPGVPGEPIFVEHCVDIDSTERTITTSAGNIIRSMQGSMYFIDTDEDGNVVSEGEESVRIFDLIKDDDGSWFVHHADVTRCIDTPWGFSLLFDLRDHLVDGEWQFQVIERGMVESCD